MKQPIWIFESPISNKLIDLIRLICVVLIVLIPIYLIPVNRIASVIFSLTLLSIILLSIKQKIVINNDSIKFEKNRIIEFLSKKLVIKFDSMLRIEYTPRKLNPLILLFPGFGGYKNAKLVFHLKGNLTIIERLKMNEKKKNELLKILENKVEILKPSS